MNHLPAPLRTLLLVGLVPAAAPAALIVPDTASRTLRVEASAGDDSDGDFSSVSGFALQSLGLKALALEGTPGEARGFAGLDTSELTSPTLTAFSASGTASATTGTGDENAFAGGFANFSFRFSVDEKVNFSLSGFLNPGTSETFVLLLRDGDTLFERDASGSFSTAGQLFPAFTYTLFGRARVDAEGESQNLIGGFGYDFSVTPVPEPRAVAALAGLGLLGFAAFRRLRRG
jgi:hypothetical protein